MELILLPGVFAICHLSRFQGVPQWAWEQKDFLSITYTADELSIVCPIEVVPPDIECEQPWSAIKVLGPLDFSLTGILASLLAPLAAGAISIFAVSTFETDYILVHEQDALSAKSLLEHEGHTFALV